MLSQFMIAIRVLVLLTAMTGVMYPLLVWGVAQTFFPQRAQGSLRLVDGVAVGSDLIGQEFTKDSYLWGRPSATNPRPYTAFDAATSSSSVGSNLSPTNPKLIARSAEQRDRLLEANRRVGIGAEGLIPIDLLTASGSGLDPHISPAGARYQVARIARARGLDSSIVERVVREATEPRAFGLIGEPVVSVLRVNLALDEISRSR